MVHVDVRTIATVISVWELAKTVNALAMLVGQEMIVLCHLVHQVNVVAMVNVFMETMKIISLVSIIANVMMGSPPRTVDYQ